MRLFPSLTALAVVAVLACPSHADPTVADSVTISAEAMRANGTGKITLHWTAPGDDSLTGTAAVYDMRCTTYPLNALNFGRAQFVARMPKPNSAGTPQTVTVTGLIANQTYWFAIETADASGNWSGISNVVSKVAVAAVGVSEDGLRITDISKPWPNPARSSASFSLSLSTSGNIEIQIFDLMGRHVRTLAKGPWAIGDSSVTWDLRDEHGGMVPSAVYKVRARLGTQEFVRSVVVVR